MDHKIQLLLRQYLQTKDGVSAIEFVEAYLRVNTDPVAHSDEFYEAFWWLYDHPAFFYQGAMRGEPGFLASLDMSVQKVCPATGRIEDEKELNTHVEIWLEAGPWGDPDEARARFEGGEGFYQDSWADGVPSHDYNLDCGAPTYEEAIIKMAALVKEHYGDYEKSE